MSGFRWLLIGLAVLLCLASEILAGNKSAVRSCWTGVIATLATAGVSLLSA